jgi:hypothetical protein
VSERRAPRGRAAGLDAALALAWLLAKHEAELRLMKGQSSIWYFLESFCISALAVNVSIALTTGVLTAPVPSASTAGGAGPGAAAAGGAGRGRGRRSDDGGGDSGGGGAVGGALSVANEVQRQIVRGMLNRLSGTTGMQLINVNNVGIQLGGLDLSNRLVNQVGASQGEGSKSAAGEAQGKALAHGQAGACQEQAAPAVLGAAAAAAVGQRSKRRPCPPS